MNKVLIITAHIEYLSLVDIDLSIYDSIICADAGYKHALTLGITPSLLIGDYDSMDMPQTSGIIKLPMEKDMTDSEAAIDLAISKGARYIDVLGGLGGRFDHTMGNIGLLAKYCGKISHLAFIDGQNYVFMVPSGKYTFKRSSYKYLGLIAYGGIVEGLTLEKTKYLLNNFTLTDKTTLGVSNEILEDKAYVSFNSGNLLVIFSKDVDNL